MSTHRRVLAIAIAAAAALSLTHVAQAQRPGARPAGTGAGGIAPVRPTGQPGGAGAGSGDVMRIVKFTPADEAKDPDLIGTLTLKPFKAGAKSVTVRMLKQEDAKITIGTASFTPDRYPEILSKGLQCSVSWTPENDKPTSPKNMNSINFQTVNVIGIVEKVEGDVITLKNALPSDGRNWIDEEMASTPIAPPTQKPPPPGSGNRPPPPTVKPQAKKVKPRKIKIKAMEELSKLTDENNQDIAAGDIPPGTKVEVDVIMSNTTGILTSLAYTNANAVVNKDTPGIGPRPGPRPGPGGRGGGGG